MEKALKLIAKSMPGALLIVGKPSDWTLADKVGLGTALIKKDWWS